MLEGKRVLLIVNPAAGRGKRDQIEHSIRAGLEGSGASTEVRRTEGPDDAREWAARSAADGFDVVVAAGGDGTVTAAAAGIVRAGSDVPLGVVPLGTGNGLARVLHIPMDPARAVRALADGTVVRLDVMRRVGTDALALIFFGAGLDAEINRDADPESKARFGYLAYLAAGARNLWGRRNHRIALTLDGHSEVLSAHTVTLFNAASLELAGIDVGPDVDPHDGQLDVAVLRSPGFLRSLAAVLRLVSGPRGVGELRRARRVRIEATPPLLVHADGDVEGSTPLEVELLPHILPVIAGSEYRPAGRADRS
jgi:diacylglycerol kinase (ATP)